MMSTPKSYTTAAGKRAAIERAQDAAWRAAHDVWTMSPADVADLRIGLAELERSVRRLRATVDADVAPRRS